MSLSSTPPLDEVGLRPAEAGTTRPLFLRSRVAMKVISTLMVPGSLETQKLARLGAELITRDLETAGSNCPAYEELCHAQQHLYTRLFRS